MGTHKTKIGVLAIQGAFIEHVRALQSAADKINSSRDHKLIDVDVIEVRLPDQLDDDLDAMIIPGGESTVMKHFLNENEFRERFRSWTQTPSKLTWGICAGLILLSNKVEDFGSTLGGLDITCGRNGFGRQIDSFESKIQLVDSRLKNVAKRDHTNGVFIRAPIIKTIDSDDVIVLGRLPTDESNVIGDVIAVRQGNSMACTFHPELTDDTAWHEYFVKQVVYNKTNKLI